ncbi:MAG: ribonuclease P protein component [Chloroflexi bacterium]|nr:ribonuclease P protein component [Chloroflexota bacterium]
MKRKFRLTSATDFKRVRRSGNSYAHPLIVLICSPNMLEISRFGISAGRSVGNAISRNKAKRQLREIIRPLVSSITIGWDIVFLARRPLSTATYSELETAVQQMLHKVGLLDNN